MLSLGLGGLFHFPQTWQPCREEGPAEEEKNTRERERERNRMRKGERERERKRGERESA